MVEQINKFVSAAVRLQDGERERELESGRVEKEQIQYKEGNPIVWRIDAICFILSRSNRTWINLVCGKFV